MTAIATIYIPDFLRVLTMIVLAIILLGMPRAVFKATAGRATHYAPILVFGFELMVLGKFAGMIAKWNTPLGWYGTPITLVAGAFIAWYVIKILTGSTDASRQA